MKKKYYKEKSAARDGWWMGLRKDPHIGVTGYPILLGSCGIQSYNNSFKYHGVEIQLT